MKAYLLSFLLGIVIGARYATYRVKSPGPPTVALVGLFGMVLGEGGLAWAKAIIRYH